MAKGSVVQGTAARFQGTYKFTAEGVKEGEIPVGGRGLVKIPSVGRDTDLETIPIRSEGSSE